MAVTAHKDGHKPPARRRTVALVALALVGALVLVHEASVRNVYDELLLEGPESPLHLALPGRGAVDVPTGFERRGSGVERAWGNNRRSWAYVGDGMGSLFGGEPYEPQGLYLSVWCLWEGSEVRVYANSGFWAAPDGNGYCVEVHWTYDARAHTLKVRTDFSRDGADGRDDISADEFLAGTGLSREDVERWAGHAFEELFLRGYLEANGGRTRFSGGDLGEFAVVDATDWGAS